MFFRCDFSHLFWFCSSLHLNSYELVRADFLESWEMFCNRVKDRDKTDEICQEFAFGLWRLWKSINEVVFNGLLRYPLEVLEAWRMSTSEFRDAVSQRVEDNDPKRTKTVKVANHRTIQW